MGEFKNSTDGCASLVPTVRTMHSHGQGLTEDREGDQSVTGTPSRMAPSKLLAIPPRDGATPERAVERARKLVRGSSETAAE